MRLDAMDCSAEERLVRMHLSGRAEVHRVGVDLDARTVTVTHDVTTELLLGWLNDLGLGSSLVSDRAVPTPAGVSSDETRSQRAALTLALIINAGFFIAELTTGLISGSMGLVADSLDMLADAGVYALSLIAVGGAVTRQKRLAAASGYLQLGLAVLGLAEVVRRVAAGEPPPQVPTMVIVSGLALMANLVVLVVLRRARGEAAHLQAAWIFTSNDIKVNILVIVAGLLVAATNSAAPDLVVGALIFLVVANGARRILRLSRG